MALSTYRTVCQYCVLHKEVLWQLMTVDVYICIACLCHVDQEKLQNLTIFWEILITGWHNDTIIYQLLIVFKKT